MANKTYTTMSLDALKFLCSTINKVVDLPTSVISDTSIATNTTHSSYKIGLDMDNMENEIKSYVDTIIAGLNKLTKEIINDKSLVVKDNVLYLYKADDDTSNDYMQMMLINGVAVELGSTKVDMGSYYDKDTSDSRFAAKLDLDTLTASFNDLKTAYDTHVADTVAHLTQEERDKMLTTDDIATIISDTPSDELVASEKAVDSAIKGVVFPKPNLLDNSWFSINQRGQTSYATTGVASMLYCVDRWKQQEGTVTVKDGCINFTSSGITDNYKRFAEHLEWTFAQRPGKYTVSILAKVNSVTGTVALRACNGVSGFSATYASGYVSIPLTQTNDYQLLTTTFTIKEGNDYTNSACVEILCQKDANIDIDIKAIKLETGAVSTLTIDAPPNYQQELAKCQRYYQRIKVNPNAIVGQGCIRNVNTSTRKAQYRIFIPISQPMRKTPTLGYKDLKICDFTTEGDVIIDDTLTGLERLKIKDMAIQSYTDNQIQVRVTTSNVDTGDTELARGNIGVMLADGSWTGSYIEFSADL